MVDGGADQPTYFPTEPTNLGVSLMLGVQRKKELIVANLAMSMGPTSTVRLDELKRIYIGQLPRGVSDIFVEKLVKTCGNIENFTRTKKVNGEPARYAFVEFEAVEGMLRALKVLNNKPLRETKLLVKVDLKTENFIKEWSKIKFAQWVNQQKLYQKHLIKKAQETGQPVDPEKLKDPTFQEWEKFILGNVKLINDKIAELVDDRNYYETNMQLYVPEILFAKNLAENAKYNESEREKERIRRVQLRQREREKQERDMIADWLDYERQIQKDRDRKARRMKQLEMDKKDMIEADLNYDSGPQKAEKKRNPERYFRKKEERKKQRERERREDQQERKREEEERAERERIEAEQRRIEEERIQKEQEFLNRPKSKFVKVDQELIPAPQPFLPPQPVQSAPRKESSDDSDSVNLNSNQSSSESEQQKPDIFKQEEEEQEDEKEVKKGGAHAGGVEAVIKSIQDTAVKPTKQLEDMTYSQIKTDEEVKQKYEKVKELYKQLPRSKHQVYAYELDYSLLRKKNIFEEILRPWLAKKIIEYLDEEEHTIIMMYLRKVKSKIPPEQIEAETRTFLDEKQSESFVMKMWQLLIFEQMKIKAGV